MSKRKETTRQYLDRIGTLSEHTQLVYNMPQFKTLLAVANELEEENQKLKSNSVIAARTIVRLTKEVWELRELVEKAYKEGFAMATESWSCSYAKEELEEIIRKN